MRTSVVTFESRLLRRFRYLAADASLYACTDAESVQVPFVVSNEQPRDVMPLVPQATATRLLITNTTKLVAVAAELRKASDEKRRLLLVQADRLLDERQELRGR
jgi:hypothetical protein